MSKKLVVVIIIAVAVIYVVAGAVIPYIKQPEVSQSTIESFDIGDYYGDKESQERAMVIADNGEALSERIRLIANAKERIILSTFEFDSDESGKDMLAALINAADRGVKVTVIVDGMAGFTQIYGNPYFIALASNENAELKIYNPVNLLKPWKIMARLHDKYLIADSSAYILGGRNTYDFFLGDYGGYKNYDWDVLVYSLSGKEDESLGSLVQYYNSIWGSRDSRTIYDGKLVGKLTSVKNAAKELSERYSDMEKDNPEWFLQKDYIEATKPVNKITLLSNPIETSVKEPVLFYNMTSIMKEATETVRFHTPYILCNDRMLSELKFVCDSGTDVLMMTNSVANNGNPFGAMDYELNKGEILDTGVTIAEYDGGVSYHGKCFTVDKRLSGIGSFNWDMRSAYIDTELMIVIDSEEINKDMSDKMSAYEKESLTVIDEKNSMAPEKHKPQQISSKRNFRKKAVRLIDWARFLM